VVDLYININYKRRIN